MDNRLEKLAKNIVNYSCKIKAGEKVLINAIGFCDDLVKALVKQVYLLKAMPFVKLEYPEFQRELLLNITREHAEFLAKKDCAFMQEMQAYIGIRSGDNIFELSDVPEENVLTYNKYYSSKLNKIRVPKTKWVVLKYPNASMAQKAKFSTQEFEDYYFKTCSGLDYENLEHQMTPLVNLINTTNKVRITGYNNTDISFSIKNIGAVKCHSIRNIPDGEVYTAPVKNSVNGRICFNTPSSYNGVLFENIVLDFVDGKIICATANNLINTKKLNNILDTDEGARYIGEFAMGLNPYITKPMSDILFDEKIAGSIHFTPGQCYAKADNNNHSEIHWDLVLIQTAEFGGGEIYFDDVLIRKNGLFVVKELLGLNPENLV